MNTRITLLIAALSVVAGMQANDKAYTDSINIVNPNSVKVIEKDGKVTIEINGQKDNSDYIYSRTIEPSGESVVREENRRMGFRIPFVDRDFRSGNVVKRRQNFFDASLCLGGFGFVMPLNAPDALNFKTWQTVEWNFDHLVNVEYYPRDRRHTHFRLGFGMQWRIFGLDNMRWMRADDLTLTAVPWDSELHDRHSQINTYSLTIPFAIVQPLGSDFKLTAGAKACFNIHAKVYNRFSIDDVDYTESFGNLHQRVVTPEIFGALTWEGIGVYVNYAPCGLIKSGKGPDLESITIGLAIAY